MHKSDSDWIVIPFVAGLGQIPVAGPQEKKPPTVKGGPAFPRRPKDWPLLHPKTGVRV